MRLGKIQRDIIAYLERCEPEIGGVICSTTRAPEFRGLDLAQVERALEALIRRNIVRRDGPIRLLLVRHR